MGDAVQARIHAIAKRRRRGQFCPEPVPHRRAGASPFRQPRTVAPETVRSGDQRVEVRFADRRSARWASSIAAER